MQAQKAVRPGKDWYSVSVETLKGWGLLLLVLVVMGGGFFGYRIWERNSTKSQAGKVIEDAGRLLARLQAEKKASGFARETASARESLEEARRLFSGQSYPAALTSGQRSRDLLQSIIDSLELRGAGGQAQFISLQGEVEFRRGDGGDWQEARSRVQLQPGDYVRTSEAGSAEIMFLDGTLYTVRPNTQFIVSSSGAGPGGAQEQSIQMEYGWVNLSTSARSSNNIKTPGAVARVKESSEAFVAVDKDTSQGRFGAVRGGMELAAKGGMRRELGALEQVTQTGDLLSEPRPLPAQPQLLEPEDNLNLDLDRSKKVVLAWAPVAGSPRYALQVSRNHLFVDNVIDAENRTKTRATLGIRGEGTFQWRVAAYGSDGQLGPWSPTRRFRVGSSRAAGGDGKDATPPELDLEDVKTYGSIFFVAGRSEPGARIEVNGEQVKTGADGAFTKPVQLTTEGWNIIEVRARDVWGNETVRRQRVFVENP